MTNRSPPRYTVTRAAGMWHVFDTRRNTPVAFSATQHEHYARALAATYNHYWHLTLAEGSCSHVGPIPSSAQ